MRRGVERRSLVAIVSIALATIGAAQESTPTSTRPAYENRLAKEASPYLRQHGHNPVNWYPWGEEAFARAVREQKPIFLSIGYASCHWCHVMERESFEDVAIAAELNASFVSIKVDREERPDVDRVYMQAAVRAIGEGGWPLNLFLTPDRKPFFAGTYFPPDDGPNQRGFRTLVHSVAEAWKEKRQTLTDAADGLARVMTLANLPFDELDARAKAVPGAAASKPSRPLDQLDPEQRRALEVLGVWGERRETTSRPSDPMRVAADRLKDLEDEKGGFGLAPKFPSPTLSLLLLRQWARSRDVSAPLDAVRHQYDAMARGGIRDHLAGGFHRYSTDRAWQVPHFEKMLYDQALNARVLIELSQATGDETYTSLAREVLDFTLRDMRAASGGFIAAFDATTDGVEGATYLWTREQVAAVLSGTELAAFTSWAGFDRPPAGSGEETIAERRAPAEVAKTLGLGLDAVESALREARGKLLAARRVRPQPARVDHVITGWNAWFASALARASLALNDVRYRDAAVEIVRVLTSKSLRSDGLYARRLSVGDASPAGELSDQAAMIEAFLDLHELTLDPGWLERARSLTTATRARFGASDGGFFDSVEPDLIFRTREVHDGAWPSGISQMNVALARLARISGEPADLDAARRALDAVSVDVAKSPVDSTYGLIAWDLVARPVARVALGGPIAVARLLRAPITVGYSPHVVLTRDDVPTDRVRATVCIDTLCFEPVSRADELLAQVNRALRGDTQGAESRKR